MLLKALSDMAIFWCTTFFFYYIGTLVFTLDIPADIIRYNSRLAVQAGSNTVSLFLCSPIGLLCDDDLLS